MPRWAGVREMRLMANLCTIPPEDLLKMTAADYGQLQKAYQDFTEVPEA